MFSINFSSALEVKRWFLALLLIMFNTHYLLVDFGLISITKLTVMALCPFLLLSFHKNISKPLIIALLYLLAIYICALQHPAQFRMTTIIYTALYVFLLVTFTTILYSEENVLTLNFAIKLLNRLIWIYILVVIAQQLFILIGIRHFTPLNLGGDSYLEVNRVPGLSLEPSHSGRIMCVAFYAWLKLNEFQKGEKIDIHYLCAYERRFFLAFLYAMLFMGSATAVLALILLSFYFINRRSLLILPIVLIVVLFINERVEFKALNRTIKMIAVVSEGDKKSIGKTDGSAAYRIYPIINTIESDISKKEFWIGNGIDSAKNKLGLIDLRKSKIGNINDYGFICYTLLLLLIYSCAIYRFFSLETLFFVILMSCTLANVYYSWGIMIIFTIIRYFQIKYECGNLRIEECDETE